MTALRSLLFLLWFAALSIILSLVFWPVLLLPRGATIWLARTWARAVLWGLKIFAGIGFEVRGLPPSGPVLVASKHMSMWDTLALYLVLDRPGIVLKRELLYVPFFGWFVWKAAAIPIDREGRASALRKMSQAAKRVLAEGRPVLIFPEGTRKKPGATPDYKPGVAGLYGLLDVPCVPVALNSGVYWTSFLKYPGTITLEFLEVIPPGLKRGEFMALLEQRIETATTALLP
jgi:1-acyl-sn-glycerol-3-phosphate acyltransferase